MITCFGSKRSRRRHGFSPKVAKAQTLKRSNKSRVLIKGSGHSDNIETAGYSLEFRMSKRSRNRRSFRLRSFGG